MFRADKQTIAGRLNTIVQNNFNGVVRQYAKASGVKVPTLEKYLNAISTPGGENLVRLAEVANVTTDWILTGQKSNTQGASPKIESTVVMLSEEDFGEIFLRLAQLQNILDRARLGKGTFSPALSKSQKELRIILKKLQALIKKR